MASGKFVAYYRVSTRQQGRSGLGLEAQKSAVNAYLNGGNWTISDEFVEVESGRQNHRPELQKALAACRVRGAVLVVAKLDRLSRNAHFLLGLKEAGVKFTAVDMPFANELVVGIMANVAEAEAEMISARTKAALGAAKARGVKLGTPENLTNKARSKGRAVAKVARKESAARWLADVRPMVSDAVAECGSLRTAASRLNEQGIPARRGGSWTATQVMRVLQS
jgi:DNA invertase Pin-like site-specific DNA recombinase